jgi:hypothetical protein
MAGEEAPVPSGAAALEAAPAARVAFEDFIVPDGGLWTPPHPIYTHTPFALLVAIHADALWERP